MENPIPDELMHQIFIRLPAKSLVRFRCVCKQWHSYIASPYFISCHKSALPLNPTLLLRRYLVDFKEEEYTLHDDNQEFHASQTLHFPFKCHDSGGSFFIMGCVDGLVCLWDDEANGKFGNLIVWNPAIRKCVMSSSIEFYTRSRESILSQYRLYRVFCFGFAYDHVVNDYKVMTIAYCQLKGAVANTGELSFGAVFSLGTRSWKSIPAATESKIFSRPCTLGSVIYRISWTNSYALTLASFDVISEEFLEFECPMELRTDVPYCDTDLSILHNSLAIVHKCDQGRFDIWVMMDDGVAKSWTKQYSIDLGEISLGLHLVGFGESGLAIFAGGGSLVDNPGVGNPFLVKFVRADGRSMWHAECYRETLLLLEGGDDVPTAATD